MVDEAWRCDYLVIDRSMMACDGQIAIDVTLYIRLRVIVFRIDEYNCWVLIIDMFLRNESYNWNIWHFLY